MFSSWLESCEDCVVFRRFVLLLGGRLVLSWVWDPFGVPVGLIAVAAAVGITVHALLCHDVYYNSTMLLCSTTDYTLAYY